MSKGEENERGVGGVNKLPASWRKTSLDAIANFEMGQAPPGSASNFDGIGTIFVKAGEFSHLTPLVREWTTAPLKFGLASDVFICVVGATAGKINLGIDCAIGRSVAAIRPKIPAMQKYIYYHILPKVLELRSESSGSAQGVISQKDLSKIEFAIAPLAEQTRIVEKLEELLSDLDAGVSELKAAQKKLGQYRQSLLKAAVEGALTAQWRAQHAPTATGAQLLERILKERRARWEAKQLAKFAEQGKAAPKDWQKKYQEPVRPDTEGLPTLPQGWIWSNLDSLIEEGPQNGLYLPATQYGRGMPILRIDDYQIGWHRPRAALNLVDADESTVGNYSLKTGDIVINRVNSMTHLGKSLNIDDRLHGVLFESNMMRLSLSDCIDVDYVSYYLGADIGRSRLIRDAKWAVNQASINQQDVKRTPIPIPSQSEQRVITEILQRQLAAIEAQYAAIDLGLKQSAAQRKNILKAAFSGQLVPQDPGDEPAAVLLERIRAERAAHVKAPKARRVAQERA